MGISDEPGLKMEFLTVLKNPETHVNIGDYVLSERRWISRISRRLISQLTGHNTIIGILTIFILILFLTQLPLHLQVQNQTYELEEIQEKINHLLIAKEIDLNRRTGYYGTDKSDAERSRRTRTASAITPHFYLHGSGMSALDGKFKWKWPENRAFDRHDDFRAQPSDDNTITEVQIIKPGIYALFAKVTANGRQTHDSSVLPPVGIILKKRCNDDRDSPEDLEEAWTTQDERGVLYGALSGAYHLRDRYPLDTLVIVGLHSLRTNDLIYIQRPAEVPYDPSNPHDRYINDEKKAQFGVFLVEPCQTC